MSRLSMLCICGEALPFTDLASGEGCRLRNRIALFQRLKASAFTADAMPAGEFSNGSGCRRNVVLYAKWADASEVGRGAELLVADKIGKNEDAGVVTWALVR